MRRLLIALLLLAPSLTLGQAYPSKPIRMILVLGGGAEIAARLIAQHAGAALGQPMVIEPQSAAGGTIGANMVAKAAPDGYTLLYAATQTQMYHSLLTKTTPYDPLKDFTPVVRVGDALLCIVANADAPFRSFRDMVDYAKRNPGKLSYSSSGIGTVQHLSGELLRQAAGIDMLHVPFKGGAQQTTALMSGEVPVSFTILATVVSPVKAGKVRVLAINNAKRYAVMPDIPTVAEEVPGYELPPGWMAIFGPAGMPAPITARLNAEVVKAMNLPDVRARMDQVAININTSTPEELGTTLRRDFERAAAIIKAAGIKPE
jgi:tripartite-type tricarboxylate transporter receptor subunit TctC